MGRMGVGVKYNLYIVVNKMITTIVTLSIVTYIVGFLWRREKNPSNLLPNCNVCIHQFSSARINTALTSDGGGNGHR